MPTKTEITPQRIENMIEPVFKTDFLSLYHSDCMEIMKQYPDKYFDLAIVDPPYGIHDKILKGGRTGKVLFGAMYEKNQWDKEKPTKEYFNELIRISKNQVICGGNYFTDILTPTRAWIIWDKLCEGMTTVNPEMIWTSFEFATKIFKRGHGLDKGFMNKEGKNIHPTQKPKEFYDFIIFHCAKPEFKIIDTHFGSGSIALAVDKANRLDKMNLHLTACEIYKEYIDKAIKRIKISLNQTSLF